ncbi:MAG: hypothetical protein AAF999_07340 [Pseudomonadota bacterium]
MTDKHWAVFALKDIKNALDADRYDVASFHIDDAIAAIVARDDQDGDTQIAESHKNQDCLRQRM